MDLHVDMGAFESSYVRTTTGLERDLYTHFSIYPNPTNAFLTLESQHPDTHSIEIVSPSGQLIYRTTMEGNLKLINLSPFSKGIYFVRLSSKEGVWVEKVVKN